MQFFFIFLFIFNNKNLLYISSLFFNRLYLETCFCFNKLVFVLTNKINKNKNKFFILNFKQSIIYFRQFILKYFIYFFQISNVRITDSITWSRCEESISLTFVQENQFGWIYNHCRWGCPRVSEKGENPRVILSCILNILDLSNSKRQSRELSCRIAIRQNAETIVHARIPRCSWRICKHHVTDECVMCNILLISFIKITP